MAFRNWLRRLFSTSAKQASSDRSIESEFREIVRTRVVPLSGDITDELANTVIATMLFLRADSPRPLEVRIDSRGGSVVAGLAIFDAVLLLPDRTHTSCTTTAAGIAALILAAGTHGHRTLGREAHVQIIPISSPQTHEPAMDGELRRVEDTFAQLLSRHTGQPLAAALADVRAGKHFGPADAIAYGLADHIR